VNGQEPGNALRGLLDLPLRQSLAPELQGAIAALGTDIRSAAAAADWAPFYARAIKISDEILGTTDGRLEVLQRHSLSIEDPMEARARIAQAPRREAERLRTEALANVQRLVREWLDRAKRQQEHVAAGCAPYLREARLVERVDGKHGMTLSLDARWWSEFSDYARQCCDEWTKNFCLGLEADVGPSIAEGLGELARRHGPPGAPVAWTQPVTSVQFDTVIEAREVETPSVSLLFVRAVRTTFMMMMGFVSIIVNLAKPLSSGGGGHGSMAEIGQIVLSVISLACFVTAIYFGVGDARRQRETLQKQGLTTWRDSAVTQLRGELDKILDRHRRLLERWAALRADQWTAAIDRWWDTRVEPRFVESDAMAAEHAKELKLQQGRLQEELGGLRALRNQLSQTTLFELRRRLRDLSEGAP